MTNTLHEQLVDRQATPELERKKVKAERRGIWTQEDIDYADRSARELIAWIKGDTDLPNPLHVQHTSTITRE